jgi:hypothetical protein
MDKTPLKATDYIEKGSGKYDNRKFSECSKAGLANRSSSNYDAVKPTFNSQETSQPEIKKSRVSRAERNEKAKGVTPSITESRY